MEQWQTFGSVSQRLSLLKFTISSASPSPSGLVSSSNFAEKHEYGNGKNQEISNIRILKQDLKNYDLSFKIPLFPTMDKLVEEEEDEAEEEEENIKECIESTDF